MNRLSFEDLAAAPATRVRGCTHTVTYVRERSSRSKRSGPSGMRSRQPDGLTPRRPITPLLERLRYAGWGKATGPDSGLRAARGGTGPAWRSHSCCSDLSPLHLTRPPTPAPSMLATTPADLAYAAHDPASFLFRPARASRPPPERCPPDTLAGLSASTGVVGDGGEPVKDDETAQPTTSRRKRRIAKVAVDDTPTSPPPTQDKRARAAPARDRPPRPANAWICYRSAMVHELKSTKTFAKLPQADVCESASLALHEQTSDDVLPQPNLSVSCGARKRRTYGGTTSWRPQSGRRSTKRLILVSSVLT